MTFERLSEIIGELRGELLALDECIVALERLAGLHRKRGRPRKTPLGNLRLSRTKHGRKR